MHPFCPVVELHNFLLTVVHLDGRKGKVSLLLLHSVMFTGASFAPLSVLQKGGYDSRLSAKADFYTKAKLLYDFGYEPDRVRVVQALLLMSYRQGKLDIIQNHWYWVTLANIVACSIGLHRDPTENMTAEDTGLWRQLGWTCFVRDRFISLGVRHPPTIQLQQFDLQLLQTSDFQVCEFPREVQRAFPDCEILKEPEIQVALAQTYIENVKLCIIIDGMFTCRYK